MFAICIPELKGYLQFAKFSSLGQMDTRNNRLFWPMVISIWQQHEFSHPDRSGGYPQELIDLKLKLPI